MGSLILEKELLVLIIAKNVDVLEVRFMGCSGWVGSDRVRFRIYFYSKLNQLSATIDGCTSYNTRDISAINLTP